MSNSKKSFVGGAAILAAAGLIGKVIGMFYRVWLTDLITSEGMGLYGTPYSVYNFLLCCPRRGCPRRFPRWCPSAWFRATARAQN